jgi:ubiquinone/menaquinone biosynthesis C-methylase UbiE
LSSDEDVPSPIDFHDPVQAKIWEVETIRNRPWRPQFFSAFAENLATNFPGGCTVLELGSGPGHLAEHLLTRCTIRHNVLLDFSQAMHSIARERIAPFFGKSGIHDARFSRTGLE